VAHTNQPNSPSPPREEKGPGDEEVKSCRNRNNQDIGGAFFENDFDPLSIEPSGS